MCGLPHRLFAPLTRHSLEHVRKVMRHGDTQASYGRAYAPPATMQRLLFENVRLRKLCARHDGVSARYELLLREGDHRIKNSLQVIASLLSLQARRAPTADTKAALQAAASRVLAVARIHDALQLNGGGDSADVGKLIEAMCKSVHAMAGDPLSINILVTAEPIEAALSLTRPLLLAVNELVINALRHAFPHDRGGVVRVTVTRRDQNVCISVADNGVGLPPDYAEGRGYGMTLVRAMIAKLGGILDAENASGARFTLTAPLLLANPVNFVSASHEACGQANARV